MTRIIQKTPEKELKTVLKNNKKYFLFLENEDENLRQMVKNIDFHTKILLLWENTFLDEYKEDGPLIIYFEEKSPLLNMFIDKWAVENAGILLESPFSHSQIRQHLQSILLVTLPDNTQARLNLHEPRKLLGVLKAIDTDKRYQQLLRPIHKIYWKENCGKESIWYQAEQSKVEPVKYSYNDIRWFQFSHTELEKMNQFEQSYFIREVSSELINNANFNNYYKNIDVNFYVDQGIVSAHKLLIYENKNIKRYILFCALWPDLIVKKEVQKIIFKTDMHENVRFSQLYFWLEQQGKNNVK